MKKKIWDLYVPIYEKAMRADIKIYADPEAPYDGYIEDDDTEEKARTVRLKKKRGQ